MRNDIDVMTFLQAQKELEHTSDARTAYYDAYNKIHYGKVKSHLNSWHNILTDGKYFLAYLLIFIIGAVIILGAYLWFKNNILIRM